MKRPPTLRALGVLLITFGMFGMGASTLGRPGSQTEGDEAPIRVKNGSLVLELTTTAHKWIQDASGAWYQDTSAHTPNPRFAITAAAQCGTPQGQKPILRVIYDDHTWVQFQVRNSHTMVTIHPAGRSLVPDGDRVLRYGTAGKGYIHRLREGEDSFFDFLWPSLCRFDSAAQLTDITINP